MGKNSTENELKNLVRKSSINELSYLVKKINSLYGLKFDEINLARFINNSIIAGSILNDTVDFLKKLGALDEFVKTLNIPDKEFLIALLESRPKICGGNPFA